MKNKKGTALAEILIVVLLIVFTIPVILSILKTQEANKISTDESFITEEVVNNSKNVNDRFITQGTTYVREKKHESSIAVNIITDKETNKKYIVFRGYDGIAVLEINGDCNEKMSIIP